MHKGHFKYCIVGAGLSGLTTAHQLLQKGENDFIVLEGRESIGGRIKTEKSIDLGATWFQSHHTHLSSLLESLSLQKFKQYSKGKSVLVYNSMAPAHYFESDPNGPAAYRIAGGSISIINALAETFRDKIRLNTKVVSLTEENDLITLKTSNASLQAKKVILALPPQIATGMDFEPALPENLLSTMTKTHTWMSNAIKVGMTFKKPFWRHKNFSGTVIGQIGPVIELYDHTNDEESTFALMGFVNEGLRDESDESRKERILSYLEKHLGTEIRDYLSYFEKDWSQDSFTACERLKSIYMSPRYGNALFNTFYLGEKVLFSGAETAAVYGGYMEGAVYSGLNAAQLLVGNS